MIIVTGGAGFIGSAFVWKLNKENITNILIVDNIKNSEKWQNLVPLRFQEYLHKSTFQQMLLHNEELPFKVEAIIHMGACSTTTEHDMDYLFENNFRYTQLLANYALHQKIPFIYASSAATYGDGQKGFSDDHQKLETLAPINRYGYSKHLFDLWAYKNKLLAKMTGLKFFNVFGPNEYHKGSMMSVACKAYEQINETGRLKLFKSYQAKYQNGAQMRDFVYIKDVIDVIWWLLQNPKVIGLFNLGTGKARTWNDLANAVFKAMGKKPNIKYIEMPENVKAHYQYFTEADMTKLKKAGCPVKIKSLEENINDYVNNYLKNNFHPLS